jgi:hypothetical protein
MLVIAKMNLMLSHLLILSVYIWFLLIDVGAISVKRCKIA